MKVPEEVIKKVQELTDGEWFSISFDESQHEWEFGLDGYLRLSKLEKLVEYLKTLPPPDGKQ